MNKLCDCGHCLDSHDPGHCNILGCEGKCGIWGIESMYCTGIDECRKDGAPEGCIPWELSKALSGKWKIVTRSGIEIPSVHYFEGSDITNPVCGIVNEDVETWTVEGMYFSDRTNSPYDLFLKKKTKVVWANVYPQGPVFNTEDAADSNARFDRITGKAIRIEYEE